MSFDYTTIDLAKLRKLPMYRVPNGNNLSEHYGSACFMDPPGYPSYFIQNVYNSRGDTPRNGPDRVIVDPEDEYRTYVVDNIDLRALWVPLPYEAPVSAFSGEGSNARLYAWIREAYWYFKGGYENPLSDQPKNVQNLEYWPPNKGDLKHKFGLETDAEQTLFIRKNWPAWATPENYRPVTFIREFYPQHQPINFWMWPHSVSERTETDWWQRRNAPLGK